MTRLLSTLTLCLLIAVTPIWASCQQQEGVIVSVEDGKVVVKAIDYYGAAKKQAKYVEKTLKIVKDAVYVLDGRIVPKTMALKPGRRFYATGSSKGCFYISTLSEANTDITGVVQAADAESVTLTIDKGTDSEEITIPLAADLAGDKSALSAGATVTIANARPATVDVLSVAARQGLVADTVPKAADGILTAIEGNGAKFSLQMAQAGSWTTFTEEQKKGGKPVIQCRFKHNDPAHLTVGSRLCYIGYWKRANKMDRFYISIATDPGRQEGIVKAIDADQLTLLAADGSQQNIDIAGATVLIDGQEAAASGIATDSHAFVFAARPQTLTVHQAQ